MTRRRRVFIPLLLALSACGMPHVTEEQRIADTVEILKSAPAGRFHGKVISEKTREFATFGDVLDDAMSARVVHVGETHTNPDHHAMQERVIRGLWARDPRLAIGLEMFFRPFQRWIDAYVAGEIDEADLLRRTEYESRWRYPWRLYAPVLRFAREKRIPVVALNIPGEISRAILREGLDGLSAEQRAEIPDLDLTDERHRAFVRRVFLGSHEMPEERFLNFYTAMCAWDEAMADSTIRFLSSPAGEGRRMVILVGAGHVRERFGIPARVARRTEWPQLVIVPEEFAADAADLDWEALVRGDAGDYVFFTPPAPAPETKPKAKP
jgi:uncharacterized iron-regulated protein